jgi:hypothetical protein
MSASTSILAETYIQSMEHRKMYPILLKQQITENFIYVEDILIIYDRNKANIEKEFKENNKLL